MAGEGSMQAMATILKNNKKLLDRNAIRNKLYKSTNTKLEFKNVSEEKLEEIKTQIREKVKKQRKNTLLVTGVILLLCSVVFYLLFKDFSIDFNMFMRQV